ncbi:MAG: rRNA maturation RNase YbeY [Halofilum sp. (in: g-proteobacteria)]|nr:rRNA maturation RNase YbeY [Halofilum sp. (in: g-proteobacteria)]
MEPTRRDPGRRRRRRASPNPRTCARWAEAALAAVERPGAAITVRIVAEQEGRALNRDFRGRDYATNVLSFAFPEVPPEAAAELGAPYIGDLAVCAPVVAREAGEQGKTPRAHWAHMVVHGVLHLAGHDHHEAEQAARMEALERRVLAGLGFPDPYGDADHRHEVSDGQPHG